MARTQRSESRSWLPHRARTEYDICIRPATAPLLRCASYILQKYTIFCPVLWHACLPCRDKHTCNMTSFLFIAKMSQMSNSRKQAWSQLQSQCGNRARLVFTVWATMLSWRQCYIYGWTDVIPASRPRPGSRITVGLQALIVTEGGLQVQSFLFDNHICVDLGIIWHRELCHATDMSIAHVYCTCCHTLRLCGPQATISAKIPDSFLWAHLGNLWEAGSAKVWQASIKSASPESCYKRGNFNWNQTDK